MSVIDHTGFSTRAFFLLSSIPSLSIFLAPHPGFSVPIQFLAQTPGALLLLVLLFVTWPQGPEGVIDGSYATPLHSPALLHGVATNRPWKTKVKHFPH